MKNKIFISHSYGDVKYVDAFVEKVLKLGLNIDAGRVFCTSVEGQGIRSGEYIPDRLKEEILQSNIVFLFISKNYKNSEVCLNEVGAAWVTLEKEQIIPIVLPSVDFSEIGFLNFGKLGIDISDEGSLLKMIDDSKKKLNETISLPILTRYVKEFITEIKSISQTNVVEGNESIELDETERERRDCFEDGMYIFSDVFRQTIPHLGDGVHNIKDQRTINSILQKLSGTSLLQKLWYRYSVGDYYLDHLFQKSNGNWVFSNWENKISEIWVSRGPLEQYEYILLKSELITEYEIQSDVGGKSRQVGITNDGVIVSDTEYYSGYARINDDIINLSEKNTKLFHTENNPHWIFFALDCHRVGYNADEVMQLCERIDSGEINVSEESLNDFVRSLRNNPTVIRWN